MELRKHQREARNIARNVSSGARIGHTVAHVTPGGGKTILASVFAHELIAAGFVDQIVVLCPRDSLRTQMKEGFTVAALGLTSELVVWDPKASHHQSRMDRVVGIATTYQSAGIHSKRLLKLVQRARTLLVLDEGHHLAGPDEDEDDEDNLAEWRHAVDPLVESARHTLVMTGTLRRSDGARIPFVEYDSDGKPVSHISYTRQDALYEGAVLPIEFRMWDGNATFDYRGERHSLNLTEASGSDSKRALRTALSDYRVANDCEQEGYVLRFLKNALTEWSAYRRNSYPSRAIVVCLHQAMAKWVAERVEEQGFSVALAISDEKHSGKRIRQFRNGHGPDILVTVGMAYEGLDVPQATHLLLLTNKRARPWLEQAVARVTRVNRDCSIETEKQYAYIYIPDDQRAREFADEILSEDDSAVAEKDRKDPVGVVARGPSTFRPISAVATTRNEGSDVQGRLPAEHQRQVESLRSCFPELSHVPAHELLKRTVKLRRALGEG